MSDAIGWQPWDMEQVSIGEYLAAIQYLTPSNSA